MGDVYLFTNENVASFKSIYNFENAKVLTVLGGGEQYFSSLLYGASQVDVYDINMSSWDVFVLKFYAIINLEYEEFFDYFVTKKLDDCKYFEKLKKYLPQDVRERLANLYANDGKLSCILDFDMAEISLNNGRVIPYFNKEEYYRLKKILTGKKLPLFYNKNLVDLPQILSGEYYDIVLTSNIFYWIYSADEIEKINESVVEYKRMLSKFNCPLIQVLYCWGLNEALHAELKKNGFEIEEVPPAKFCDFMPDYVISYRRKNRK